MDPATRCPLCGNPNDCGAALGTTECWCFSTAIAREVLDRVPAEQRNAACICPACAGASPTSPAEPLPEKS